MPPLTPQYQTQFKIQNKPQQDEDLDSLLNLPPEAILLRWMNYHLEAAGAGRVVANFGR